MKTPRAALRTQLTLATENVVLMFQPSWVHIELEKTFKAAVVALRALFGIGVHNWNKNFVTWSKNCRAIPFEKVHDSNALDVEILQPYQNKTVRTCKTNTVKVLPSTMSNQMIEIRFRAFSLTMSINMWKFYLFLMLKNKKFNIILSSIQNFWTLLIMP